MSGVLSLSELCAELQVSAQTICDLRSQGRGPRGVRVGRELRFRISEIDAWLTRLENADGRIRHVRVTARTAAQARQVLEDRPRSEASIRWIPVPEFANRRGGPLSPYNVRRTFRDFLVEAGLGDSGVSLRWYRRHGHRPRDGKRRGFLGHSSTAITEGHYIERDPTVDQTPTFRYVPLPSHVRTAACTWLKSVDHSVHATVVGAMLVQGSRSRRS